MSTEVEAPWFFPVVVRHDGFVSMNGRKSGRRAFSVTRSTGCPNGSSESTARSSAAARGQSVESNENVRSLSSRAAPRAVDQKGEAGHPVRLQSVNLLSRRGQALALASLPNLPRRLRNYCGAPWIPNSSTIDPPPSTCRRDEPPCWIRPRRSRCAPIGPPANRILPCCDVRPPHRHRGRNRNAPLDRASTPVSQMGCRRTPASLWCAAKSLKASERRNRSSHGIPRRRPLPRKALRHHDGDAEGARSQSQGAGRHFAVGRRAGFRHAGQHQAGGDRRHQARRDQVSAGARHSPLARGDRGKIQPRERARLQAVRHDRRHRRQADSLQRLPGHDEPRRRGDHSRALLGELSRDGRDQLGRAGHRADDDSSTASSSSPRTSSARSRRGPSG